MTLRCRIEFKLANCWVGVSWKRSTDVWVETVGQEAVVCTAPRIAVWVCLLPCLPLHLVVLGAVSKSDPLDYITTETIAETAAPGPLGDPADEQ